MILILVVFLGLMSWTTRRSMKKQQNQRQELENSMTEGSRVMLTSGLYGTLTHVGEKQAIVELAPGAEVVVVKQAISKVVNPDEEEFSFADDQSVTETEPVLEQSSAEPALEQPAPGADDPAEIAEETGAAQAEESAEYPSAGEK
ncbi:preprotein translocase subunit YajC [Acidipropionibacterium virtanenii]|nr:preprotein translocase subunit YajC [Acidipropionibacterium virtanenii]